MSARDWDNPAAKARADDDEIFERVLAVLDDLKPGWRAAAPQKVRAALARRAQRRAG